MSESSEQNPAPEAAEPAEKQALPVLTALLRETFGERVLSHHAQHGDETVVIARQGMLDVMHFLKDDKRCAFEMMIDLTAVDLLPRTPRFEVVYHFKSLSLTHRLRVKIPLDEGAAEDAPAVESIMPLWVAADWYERECHEMYGIVFNGHPKLEPLLLYPGFVGHPLRKDYEKGRSQPLVPLRPVAERYNYGETFHPVAAHKRVASAAAGTANAAVAEQEAS